MRRQSVIQYKTGHPTAPRDVFKKIGKSWHLHFCADRDCRLVYECHDCPDVSKNGRCHICLGRTRPIWVAARDPQECCHGNCVLVVDKDELIRYRLAGPGPWFQCKTCARCHGWPCN